MAQEFCINTGGNTGAPNCDRTRGIPRFPVLGRKEFTPADMADFEAAYDAAVNAPMSDPNKLFPFPIIQDAANNATDNKKGTLGLGYTTTLLEGKPAYTWKVVIGQCQFKALRKFNGYKGPMFVPDVTNTFWGALKPNGNFVGYDVADFFVSGNDFGTGSDPVTATISVSLADAVQFNDFAAWIDTNDFNISDYKGLQDVQIVSLAAPTVSAFKLGGTFACSSVNAYDAYADALAVVGAWTAKSGNTALTITSVAKDAVLGGWTVTVDATAFGALASGAKVVINLASPAVLSALTTPVVGIEGVAYTYTKP